jgi:hypothetical protein
MRQFPIHRWKFDVRCMITADQMRAARASLGLDQRALAALSDLSLSMVQRVAASYGATCDNVGFLIKPADALSGADVLLIGANVSSAGGARLAGPS